MMLTLSGIKNLLKNDMNSMDYFIKSQLFSDIHFIKNISDGIVNSGGKRLRPLLLILISLALGYQGNKHHRLAAVIEFIHLATLLHDDVIDNSKMRHGKKTINLQFGNEASILVGDFLYSRSFQIISNVNNKRITSILANATNLIAEGEMLQLLYRNNFNVSEDDYMNVIYCKTSKLFESSCAIACVISNADDDTLEALSNFGKCFGNAFQISDDILDYISDVQFTGKDLGNDLIEGKMTLPIIYALKHLSQFEKNMVKECINTNNIFNLHKALNIIKSSGAVDYSLKIAQLELEHAKTHLNLLEDSLYKDCLLSLCDIVIKRRS